MGTRIVLAVHLLLPVRFYRGGVLFSPPQDEKHGNEANPFFFFIKPSLAKLPTCSLRLLVIKFRSGGIRNIGMD